MAAERLLKSSSFNFSEFVKTKEFMAAVVALIGTFFLFPYFFEVCIFPLGTTSADPSLVIDINRTYPWLSLDPSWNVALNKFNVDHLNWGKDIAFTYGPLAYLSTRIGWGISKYHLLLFDLFMSLNFFLLFYNAYIKSENKKIAVLIVAATCFFLPSSFGSGNALVLLAFLIFWIRRSLDEYQLYYYVMQIAIIVLLFFVKFNTSLISFFLFFISLLYKTLFTKEKKVLLIVYLFVPILLVYFLSQLFNVSPLEYLLGGLNMVSGYNEIMFLSMPLVVEYKYTYSIIAISVFIILFKAYLEKKQGLFKNGMTFLLFGTSIYVLYKQAFVRNDIQHIMDFNKFSLLFILCIPDFYTKQFGKFSYWLVAVIIVISFQFSKKRDDQLFKLKERVSKSRYVRGFTHFSDTSGFRLFPNNNQIPDSIKSKIGQSTVDVYPWNIHLLYENKLNYQPRPAFQAYTAYTSYLEDLNFNFYNSDNGPEFVIYDYDGVDNRYPLFDEPKVNLFILRNYEYSSFFSFAGRPNLVLKKKKGSQNKMSFTKIREFEISTLDVLEPKENRYYELFISNTMRGKITSLLSHSPEVFLVVKTKDGTQREFKTSKKLLESGLFSNRLFTSTQDIFNFLVLKDGLRPENEILSYSVRFTSAPSFKNNIRIVEYAIN